MLQYMNQVLLVEGKDDEHVLYAIFEKYKVEQTFKVKSKQGIDELLKSIPILLKTDIDTLGIVVDTDNSIVSRWDSISNILESYNYEIPKKISKKGMVLDHEDYSKFGLWLMPDNNNNGMLEDFISYLIPDQDSLFDKVENFISALENEKLQQYKQVHRAKAKLHTWLALQETPGVPMGLAIKKKYLDTDHISCQNFVQWINDLFNE